MPNIVSDRLKQNVDYQMTIRVRIHDNYTISFPLISNQVRMDYRGLARVNNLVAAVDKESDYFDAKIYAGKGFLTLGGYMSYWGDHSMADFMGAYSQDISSQHWGFEGEIASTKFGFASRSKFDGSISYVAMEICLSTIYILYDGKGCHGAPKDNGYIKIYNNSQSFAALKSDGSITTWGWMLASTGEPGHEHTGGVIRNTKAWSHNCGERGGPKDKGYIAIISSKCSFTAIKANGESFTWGSMGGASGPYNGAVY